MAQGKSWRPFGGNYRIVSTETVTHDLIGCAMAILQHANGHAVDRLRFGIEAVANEHAQRWGKPGSGLQARCYRTVGRN